MYHNSTSKSRPINWLKGLIHNLRGLELHQCCTFTTFATKITIAHLGRTITSNHISPQIIIRAPHRQPQNHLTIESNSTNRSILNQLYVLSSLTLQSLLVPISLSFHLQSGTTPAPFHNNLSVYALVRLNTGERTDNLSFLYLSDQHPSLLSQVSSRLSLPVRILAHHILVWSLLHVSLHCISLHISVSIIALISGIQVSSFHSHFDPSYISAAKKLCSHHVSFQTFLTFSASSTIVPCLLLSFSTQVFSFFFFFW